MAVEIRYRTMALALAAMLAGSCFFAASAQDRDSTATSEEKNWASDTTLSIDEVMVVATRTSQEVVPVQMLSGEKLRSLGTHSIADAIRYFSGVQIKDFGGIGGLKSINVRSLGSQHVGVFYDGVELGNAQNGIVDLGRFSLDNMESVSLYNGQKSATLQSAKDYASANAVYLRTKKPRFTDGKRNNWNFGLKGGSFMTVNPSVLWEHKISDRLSLSASTEFLYTTGRYKFTYAKQDGYDTTGVRQNGDVRMTRAEVALFGDIEGGYWRAKVYFYDSERGYPGAVVRGKFVHQDRQWDDNFFAQGSFKKDFAPWYSLQGQRQVRLRLPPLPRRPPPRRDGHVRGQPLPPAGSLPLRRTPLQAPEVVDIVPRHRLPVEQPRRRPAGLRLPPALRRIRSGRHRLRIRGPETLSLPPLHLYPRCAESLGRRDGRPAPALPRRHSLVEAFPGY